ncbi:uncharacterized protein K441DRAFT_556486, partial [Cenococcum geophilum 1.58]|uniref:uncharacterized protein n=1 Tax=Cenococcum geophilum 1.58 TaxID=794803 RepID=UPI00358EC59A
LFSVTHFAAFLASAYEHFSQKIDEPFDFIKASRVDNPVPRDLDEHLTNLLKHVRNSGDLIEFAAPTIASSLLLDSYPPNSHCRSNSRSSMQTSNKWIVTCLCCLRGLIVLAMFVNGRSIEESTETFERLAKMAFKRRKVLKIPIFRNLIELMISYFTDGLYAPENIEAALKQVFGDDKSTLDISHATSTGTRIGLPVATVNGMPSRRIFTNYNGVGEREKGQGTSHSVDLEDRVIRPEDGSGSIPLWEIFFPPKHIPSVGTFQDAGPFVNDPLILALSEMAALLPLNEKPDFVISLGTGEPRHTDVSENVSDNTRQKSVLRRLGEVFWEKLQDKQIREAIQTRVIPH